MTYQAVWFKVIAKRSSYCTIISTNNYDNKTTYCIFFLAKTFTITKQQKNIYLAKLCLHFQTVFLIIYYPFKPRTKLSLGGGLTSFVAAPQSRRLGFGPAPNAHPLGWDQFSR
jgi:hypothetical protein